MDILLGWHVHYRRFYNTTVNYNDGRTRQRNVAQYVVKTFELTAPDVKEDVGQKYLHPIERSVSMPPEVRSGHTLTNENPAVGSRKSFPKLRNVSTSGANTVVSSNVYSVVECFDKDAPRNCTVAEANTVTAKI